MTKPRKAPTTVPLSRSMPRRAEAAPVDIRDMYPLIAAHHGASSCISSATLVVSTTETAATIPMRDCAGRVPMSASSRQKPVSVRSRSRAPSRKSSTTARP